MYHNGYLAAWLSKDLSVVHAIKAPRWRRDKRGAGKGGRGNGSREEGAGEGGAEERETGMGEGGKGVQGRGESTHRAVMEPCDGPLSAVNR